MSEYYKGADFVAGKLDDGGAVDGVGPILWNFRSPGKFPIPDADTMIKSFNQFIVQFKDDECTGTRKLIKRDMVATNPKKPDVKYEKLSLANEYTWLTYHQFGQRVKNAAKGLMELHNFQPQERIVIYAETQQDWMVSAFAAWSLNLQVVTVYATLGAEGASYGINQTKAAVVMVDSKLAKNCAEIVKRCPTIKHFVTIGDFAETKDLEGIPTIGFETLLENGSKSDADVAREPAGDDIAVVMYTSGTTGNPKGVLISHLNMRTVVVGCDLHFNSAFGRGDRVIGYLPLAHIMELIVECWAFAMGMKVGYGNPHTLTDTGVKLAEGSFGDLTLLKPTIAAFAPAVLDKIYAGIKLKMMAAPGIVQTIFRWALENGAEAQKQHKIGANFLYQIILKKVQALVGGELKGGIAGSAPLSAEIQSFVQTVLNCPIRQGYGLTETCAASCVQDLGDNTTSNVGAPLVSACIRLRDWPEGNYFWSDKDKEGVNVPRGEVLIGGPGVAQGYLVDEEGDPAEAKKMTQKNEEEFITIKGVRYFCTGDVAQILPGNTLQIVDRKKDLFKGANGEYVALSKVESFLKLSMYCDVPMVYGRQGEDHVIALIQPDPKGLRSLATELGLPADIDMLELIKNKDVVAAVNKDLFAQCKTGGLLRFETPTAFKMVTDKDGDLAWTPDNGFLTAASKMKRPVIAAAFADDISELYKEK